MKLRVSLANLLTAAVAAAIVASGLWAADNLTIKEPTTPTATVKSDDVGGVHYQGFKIYDGTADGTTGLVVTGSGAAKVDGSAVTQPVSDAGGSLTVDGTVTANQGGAPWADNISQFGGTNISTGVGSSGAGIPRVTIAADAHDSPVAERGVRISGFASTAAPGNVSADGDNVSLWALRNGQLVQQPAFSGTLASTGSGASGTGTQRVILATDQPVVPVSDNSSTLSVDDGAGSLTVDGTVGVSGTVTVDTEFANVTDGAAAGTTGIHVLGTDGTNAQIIKTDTTGAVQIDCESGCGGGTQFAEDAAHTTGDLGTMALTVRNDAGGALAGTSGDYAPLQTDANGALRVTGGGGGTEYTEDAASAADPVGGQVMGRRRDTLATETTADGDVTAVNVTGKGEVYVKQTDAVPVTDNSGSLTVDGTVTANAGSGTFTVGDGGGSITVDNGGTFATQPGDNRAEDAASAGGETGSFVLGVRNDAAAALTSANGDFGAVAIDSAGRVGVSDLGGAVSVDDNGATLSVDDGAGSLTVDGTVAVSGSVTVAQATAANLNAEVQGDAAQDAAVSGNPVLAGGRASAAAPADVSADGDAVALWTLRSGATVEQESYAGALAVAGNGVSGTGVQRVTLASDSTGNIATIGTSVTPGTAAANLGKAEDAAAASADTIVPTGAVRRDSPTNDVSAAGDYGTLQINATGALYEQPTAGATGGCTPSKTISAATTNATNVKGSAGQIYSIYVTNTNASPRYLKLYNKATAPTVGTDVPVHTMLIPGNTSGAGGVLSSSVGMAFGTGIGFALTTGVADADTAAVAANEIVVNLCTL